MVGLVSGEQHDVLSGLFVSRRFGVVDQGTEDECWFWQYASTTNEHGAKEILKRKEILHSNPILIPFFIY